MRKILLMFLGICMAGAAFAQFPYVDINQIRFVSQADLQNCNDSSAYLGDTLITRGIVVMDGNLSEVASGSVVGGSRPFISLVDTATNLGQGTGPWQGIVVMGVFDNGGQQTPVTAIENSLAGDVLEITGIVGEFNGLIQFTPISNSAVSIVGVSTPPVPTVIQASDIQDMNRQNILPTGEKWDGAFVELQNMTVTNVSTFSGGTRTEFTIADANGNQVLVADRFVAMRVNGVATVNPNSPQTNGRFVAPSVGTMFNYIRGVIFQDENGCQGGGGFAGGYELNPFDSLHFDEAASPPAIMNVSRNPRVPNATQTVTVSADITDNDGTITGASLFYSADLNAAPNTFSSVTMTNTGSLYSGVIPAFPNDSIVRYYIEAIDDSMNVTIYPSASTQDFYTVRPNGATIMDIQTVLDVNNGDSPLVGDTLTVSGVVTASYQPGDLGYLYIQDPSATEFAGIFVEGGGTSVFTLNRGDEVSVTGTVTSQFGFTKIVATSVTATGTTGVNINPVVINPSDTNFFNSGKRELERYESMLVRYENPQAGGKVNIINPNLGFGEYTVGSGAGATVTARVLAGRQDGTQAQSSFDVSVVSDTAAYGPNLNVTPVQASNTQDMDALMGMMYYSFGNFKLTPRNNMDFVGFSLPLVGLTSLTNSSVEAAVFPNPAKDQLTIALDNSYQFNNLTIELVDVTGRTINSTAVNQHLSNMDVSNLEGGVYVVRILDNNELIHSSKLIVQ